MTPLTEKDRLRAALLVARDLHENLARSENLPSGTTLTPIGVENGQLLVTITEPDQATQAKLERVACVA